MSQFEDFIRDELPLRQVVIKAAGDPTTGSGVLAAIGTYYLDTDDNFKRYEKFGSGNTDWREVPTGTSTGGVQTDAVTFDNDAKITSVKIDPFSGTQVIDTFDLSDYKSSKYIIRASNDTTIHCTELLLLADSSQALITQYGVLGDTLAVEYDAGVSGTTVSLSATTSLSGAELSIYKFLLG